MERLISFDLPDDAAAAEMLRRTQVIGRDSSVF